MTTKPFNLVTSSFFDWDKYAVHDEPKVPETAYRHTGASNILTPVDSLAFEKWLPFAAQSYDLSADPNDYFFRPVPAFISDLPNRNGAGFPIEELLKWNPQQGRQAFQTWIGKPMFEEHGKYHPDPENPDHRLAIGVLVDAQLTPVRGYGGDKLWKLMLLAAMDRTADRKCVNKGLLARVEAGDVNTYSMGCLVGRYTCAHCGAEVGKCTHIDEKEPVAFNSFGGSLAYRLCHDIEGAELSVVLDPACAFASSDVVKIRY